MLVCGKGHEEIVFHGHNCPLCNAMSEKKRAEKQRDEAVGAAEELRATVVKMGGGGR